MRINGIRNIIAFLMSLIMICSMMPFVRSTAWAIDEFIYVDPIIEGEGSGLITAYIEDNQNVTGWRPLEQGDRIHKDENVRIKITPGPYSTFQGVELHFCIRLTTNTYSTHSVVEPDGVNFKQDPDDPNYYLIKGFSSFSINAGDHIRFSATFGSTGEGNSLDKVSSSGGSVSLYKLGAVGAELKRAKPGDIVIANVKPDDTFVLSGLYILGKDEALPEGNSQISSDFTYINDNNYSFTMPEGDAKIYAVFTSTTPPAHVHAWQYSTYQDHGIEATCSCGAKPRLTLDAADKVYNGLIPNVDIDLTNWTFSGEGEALPQVKAGDIVFGANPANAGNHKVSLTVGGATAEESYTISKRPITITADRKDCTALGKANPFTYTVTNKSENWFEAEDPDIAYSVVDDRGVDVDLNNTPEGHYYIVPKWRNENTNYEATFERGDFLAIHNWEFQFNDVKWIADSDKKPGDVDYYTKENVQGVWKCTTDPHHFHEIQSDSMRLRILRVADCIHEGLCIYEATMKSPSSFYPPAVSSKNETILAKGHAYGAWTRLDDTIHQRVCSHDATHIETAEHVWDAGVITKPATVDAEGVKTYTCKDCTTTKTEPLAKLEPSNPDPRKPEPTKPDPVKPSPQKPQPVTPQISGTLRAKMVAQGDTSLQVAWSKINHVDGYDVFFSVCNHEGKTFKCKRVKTFKGNKTFKWVKTKLNQGSAYKAYVKAYVMKSGKKKYVKTSPMIHAFAGGVSKKYTNAKSIIVTKTKVSLKKGKKTTIKAKVVNLIKNKKLMSSGHAPIVRYMTSNSAVATVNSAGKITARGKGTCSIYAYAHNGVFKEINVTVK